MRHVVISITLFTAAQPVFASSDRWETFQGTAAHSGFVDEITRFDATPRLKWSRQVHSNGIIGIAVGAQRVFVATDTYPDNGEGLFALSKATGLTEWNADVTGVASMNPPGLDDAGNVYFATGNSNSGSYMHSYAPDGTFRWRGNIAAQFENYLAPTFAYGEIAANGGYYGGIYRWTTDGTEIAFAGLPQYDMWTPTPWNDRWVAFTNRIDVINRSTNATEYYVEIPNYDSGGYDVRQAPVMVGDVAYLANSGRLIGLDLAQQIPVVNKAMQAVGQVATDGQRLFVAASGMISIRDLQGNSLRNYSIAATSMVAPFIVTSTHVISGTARGSTAVYDMRTHGLVAELPVHGQMALADNVLYIGGADGRVNAYEMPYILFQDGHE